MLNDSETPGQMMAMVMMRFGPVVHNIDLPRDPKKETPGMSMMKTIPSEPIRSETQPSQCHYNSSKGHHLPSLNCLQKFLSLSLSHFYFLSLEF